MIPALPLQPLNHISFQVPSVKESLSFYSNVLGFVQIARPDFEVNIIIF
jgi:catechol 2,3-dioxygenase-like lactoylglutathione lyase family enzyme